MLTMKKLLEFRNGDKMRLIMNALSNAGLEYLGHGSSGIAFLSKSGNVVKIFEPDNAYRRFVSIISKYNNPHFPKIYTIKHFKKSILRGNWMVKMEKLQPLTRKEYNENIGFHCFCSLLIKYNPYSLNLSRVIARDYSNNINDIKEKANEWKNNNLKFAEAIEIISKNMGNFEDDLHRENIMKRGSVWVIIDPYKI